MAIKTARPGIDRPLRVVVYTDSAGMGGAEISLSHLVANVASEIQIAVVGVSYPVVAAIAARRLQTPTMVLPASGFGMGIAHAAAFWRLRPDIIHHNLCTPWAGMTGLFTSLMVPGARVVRVDQLPLRTTHLPTLLRTRSLSLRVDVQVAVGRGSARLMEDFYALGRGTVIAIPNGVPDFSFSPSRSDNQTKEVVVGSVGRLDPMKAHDVLIRAIAQVEGVRLVILGEGAYRQALTNLAHELDIIDRVELRGWVDEPRTVLPQFDIFAHPSRSEGFPLAVVEAMLASRPVVATRVGSVAEAVSDGETGLLVDKDDVDGLAAALCRLRDHPQLRTRLGEQGRAIAVAQFTAQQMASRYEQLWYQVLATPQKPRLRVARPQD